MQIEEKQSNKNHIRGVWIDSSYFSFSSCSDVFSAMQVVSCLSSPWNSRRSSCEVFSVANGPPMCCLRPSDGPDPCNDPDPKALMFISLDAELAKWWRDLCPPLLPLIFGLPLSAAVVVESAVSFIKIEARERDPLATGGAGFIVLEYTPAPASCPNEML